MKKSIILISIAFMILSCNHNADECTENPKQGCFCTKEYKPVCGCNNKTYGNACEAGCAGIIKFTEGACK
jgi:hypothetical protein